jgi:protein SCO1/2
MTFHAVAHSSAALPCPGGMACPSRRSLLASALALASAGLGRAAWAHDSTGAVNPPQPVLRATITRHDGRKADLAALLRGRVTAMQLMFTGCSATCPIQGALFAAAEQQLARGDPDPGSVQLLSLSIDPLGDDVAALKAWRAKFGAGDLWSAVVPAMQDLDALLGFLQGRKARADRHTAQVYFFNRRAELVLRTVDFPPSREVVRLLQGL